MTRRGKGVVELMYFGDSAIVEEQFDRERIC